MTDKKKQNYTKFCCNVGGNLNFGPVWWRRRGRDFGRTKGTNTMINHFQLTFLSVGVGGGELPLLRGGGRKKWMVRYMRQRGQNSWGRQREAIGKWSGEEREGLCCGWKKCGCLSSTRIFLVDDRKIEFFCSCGDVCRPQEFSFLLHFFLVGRKIEFVCLCRDMCCSQDVSFLHCCSTPFVIARNQ